MCDDCRGITHKRCFDCYKKLSTVLLKEVDKLRDGEKMLCNHATKVVMNIDWTAAINNSKLPNKITIDGKVRDVPISKTDVPTEFKWNVPCQSCGNISLPKEQPLPIKKEKLKPSLNNINYHHIDVETTTIDRNTTKPQKTNVHVELVIVEPIVDMETISSVQHRRFGAGTIDGECIVFHSKPTHWGDDGNVYRIIATRNPTNPNELLALSSIHFDKFSESVTRQEMQAYMKLIQCSVEPTYEKVNKDDTKMRRRSFCRNSQGGYRSGQIRVNRNSGPAGTNNGMELRDIQEAQSSPNMKGANCRHVSQTVQTAITRNDGLITKVPQFYHAPNDDKFTRSIFCAPALKGCQAEGKHVLESIKDSPEHLTKGTTNKRLMDIHYEFTLARIESALLNKALSTHPSLKVLGYETVSSEATNNVLNSWASTTRISDDAAEENATNVPSESAVEEVDEGDVDELNEDEKRSILDNPPYEIGECVFYTTGNPCDQNWISNGRIIKQMRTEEGTTRKYLVNIGDGEDRIFDEYHLSGEPGTGIYTDEDVPIYSDTEYDGLVKMLTNITRDTVLLWSARSNYNVLWCSVACHLDYFGKKGNDKAVNASIENGREVPSGRHCNELKLPQSGTIVPFRRVPGALYMPRLGIATIRDRYTELIDLHQEFHCVLTQERKETTSTNKKNIGRDAISRSTYDRGCWFCGNFFAQGGSVLDWGSRLTGSSASAVIYRARQDRVRRDRRAAARRRHSGG